MDRQQQEWDRYQDHVELVLLAALLHLLLQPQGPQVARRLHLLRQDLLGCFQRRRA